MNGGVPASLHMPSWPAQRGLYVLRYCGEYEVGVESTVEGANIVATHADREVERKFIGEA